MDAEELTGSLKKLVMWYKVKELKSKGLNKTQIARCLGINRNTVRKYQSMSESEFMNSQSYRRNYNHKLDPYEDFVHKSLDSHPYLSSSQIRDWLREQYEDFPDVGQKTVYNYVQYIRRKYHISKRVGHGNRQYEKQPDTAYGEYAQVDFGERWMYDKEHHPVKVYFYAIVLCRSRYKCMGSGIGRGTFGDLRQGDGQADNQPSVMQGNVPREDMEKRIVDYAGGDSIASEWMNGLRAGKPRYYWDNLNHILRFMRTFSRETFHEAMEICLDRGAYNALMLTDTARSIQKRKKEKPADLPPMSTATIPTVAQEMPEKTNINQYSSIFK